MWTRWTFIDIFFLRLQKIDHDSKWYMNLIFFDYEYTFLILKYQIGILWDNSVILTNRYTVIFWSPALSPMVNRIFIVLFCHKLLDIVDVFTYRMHCHDKSHDFSASYINTYILLQSFSTVTPDYVERYTYPYWVDLMLN